MNPRDEDILKGQAVVEAEAHAAFTEISKGVSGANIALEWHATSNHWLQVSCGPVSRPIEFGMEQIEDAASNGRLSNEARLLLQGFLHGIWAAAGSR